MHRARERGRKFCTATSLPWVTFTATWPLCRPNLMNEPILLLVMVLLLKMGELLRCGRLRVTTGKL